MGKKIVIKEKKKSEFIIYYVVDDNNVEAYIEIGENNKKLRVNELMMDYFMDDFNLSHIYPIEETKLK